LRNSFQEDIILSGNLNLREANYVRFNDGVEGDIEVEGDITFSGSKRSYIQFNTSGKPSYIKLLEDLYL
jgi:hypothetical protein